MSVHGWRVAAGLAALLGCGCSEGPSDASTLERVRALGARIEVVGDPARSAPRPGEQADVRWLLRGPDGASEVEFVFHVCLAPERGGGVPVCEATLGDAIRGRAADPALRVAVPEELAEMPVPGPLLVVAAFCEQGTPRIDTSTLLGSCERSAEVPETASLYVEVEGDNHNPEVVDAAEAWLDGEPWPASSGASCEGPVLSRDAPTPVRLRLPDAAREQTPEGPEELLVSHFATEGAFASLFSVVERDAPAPEIEIEWEPEEVDDGAEVRVIFVVRDQRGGIDWIERCALVEGG